MLFRKTKQEDCEQSTYSELFRKYYPGLLFYATRFLSEDEAEDVVQETFLDLWKKRDGIEIGDQIQSFLYRSVYMKSINVLKHKKVENNYSQAAEEMHLQKMEYYNPDSNDVIKRIEAQELRREMVAVMNELPDKCREVFKLSYIHGMKNKEIAEVLDISLRTAEAHMYKALKFLRERLSHLLCLFLLFLAHHS